VCFSRFINLN